MPDQFADIVRSLTAPGQSGLFVQKRDLRISVLDVFAARRVETGLEALLVQVDPRLLTGIEEWPLSEGFHVVLRSVEGRSEGASLICLELSSPQFRDVFLSLAEDVCKVIAEEHDRAAAIRTMHQRLFRWQEFLKTHRPDGLSQEEQVGLFGELEILRCLFLEALDPGQAIKGWRGCKKASQDFQYPGLALEVKTTRAVTPDRIYISNLQQLDGQGIENLFLSLVWVVQNESAGLSLPALITRIRRLLSAQALSIFDEGLMEVGYLDIHESLYKKKLYQVKGVQTFAVREGFPRIKGDDIPGGVKSVKYEISIDACRPFRIEQEAALYAVRNLKGEPGNE